LVENALDQAQVLGDDLGGAAHIEAEVELFAVAGDQTLGQGDVDQVLVLFGDRGDGVDLARDDAELIEGKAVELDLDGLADLDLARAGLGQVDTALETVGVGHDGEHHIAGIDVLVGAPELEQGHAAVLGRLENIALLPGGKLGGQPLVSRLQALAQGAALLAILQLDLDEPALEVADLDGVVDQAALGGGEGLLLDQDDGFLIGDLVLGDELLAEERLLLVQALAGQRQLAFLEGFLALELVGEVLIARDLGTLGGDLLLGEALLHIGEDIVVAVVEVGEGELDLAQTGELFEVLAGQEVNAGHDPFQGVQHGAQGEHLLGIGGALEDAEISATRDDLAFLRVEADQLAARPGDHIERRALGGDLDARGDQVGVLDDPGPDQDEDDGDEDERDAPPDDPVGLPADDLVDGLVVETEVLAGDLDGLVDGLGDILRHGSSSAPQLELVLDEVEVVPTCLGERGVVADFDQLALLEDDDLVGVLDGGEPVGDDHGRPLGEEALHVLHDGALVVGIERAGRLVEEDVLGVLVDGPCDEDPLPLTLAEPVTVAADLGVVVQRQPGDELVDVGDPGGLEQLLEIDDLVGERDVLGDGVVEDVTVLHDDTALLAPEIGVVALEVDVAELDGALAGPVEAQQQLDQRGLAAARGADDGGGLAVGNGERDVVEDFLGDGAFVMEIEALDGEVAVLGHGRQLLDVLGLLIVLAVDLTEPLEGELGVLGGADEAEKLGDRAVELTDDVGDGHHHAQGHLALDDLFGGDI